MASVGVADDGSGASVVKLTGSSVPDSQSLPVHTTTSNTSGVTLLPNTTTPTQGNVQAVLGYKTMVIEVTSTATTFSLTPQATGPTGVTYGVDVVNLASAANVSTITAAGLYQLDISGLHGAAVDLTAVSGGGVTVYATLIA